MAEYIDRQAAINAVTAIEPLGDFAEIDGREVLDCLRELPAADVRENVEGKWVFKKGDMVTCCDGWYCSHCKRGFHTNVPYFKDFNFCPHCGADNRLKEEPCNGDSCEI